VSERAGEFSGCGDTQPDGVRRARRAARWIPVRARVRACRARNPRPYVAHVISVSRLGSPLSVLSRRFALAIHSRMRCDARPASSSTRMILTDRTRARSQLCSLAHFCILCRFAGRCILSLFLCTSGSLLSFLVSAIFGSNFK